MRILLASGGLDSTALAWMLRPGRLLFVDYGQRPAAGELRAVRSIARELGLTLDVRRADLSAFGGGVMAGVEASPGRPPENWPFRNQMLVTLAAMAYADDPPEEILLGTVSTDARHEDGRPAFVEALDTLVRLQSGARVAAPAIGGTTVDLLRLAAPPRALLGWTFSCHTGEWACGQCPGCVKHRETLAAIDADVGGLS